MAQNTYTRFQRSNYVVANLEKALTFYCGVLGFELNFTKDSDDDSYSYPVFEIEPGRNLRFTVLDLPNQPRILALTEITGQLAPVPFPRRGAIVLEVENIDAVVAAAEAIGCRVYEEGELHTHDGRQGREVGLVDFDENLTVIYHIPITT